MRTPIVAAVAALAAATVLGSSTAHADEVDDALFIADLHKFGVTYSTTDSALQAGNQLCGQLRGGVDSFDVRDFWADKFGSTRTAAALMASAARHLCPEQLTILDNQIRNRPPDIG